MTLLPTPGELDDAPELAALVVLEVAAETARRALLASHAALRDGEAAPRLDQTPSAAPAIALHIITLADALGRRVPAYRDALLREHVERLRAAAGHDF